MNGRYPNTCAGCRFLITERSGTNGALICTNEELIRKVFSDRKNRTLAVAEWKNIQYIPAYRPAWCEGEEM